MKNIWIFTKLEIKKYFRQPMTIGFGVVFPIAWIIINGELYGNESSKLLGGVGTVSFMFPAYIFMIMLVTGLSSLPLILSKNYENKAILRYSFTPVKRYQYLLALFLGGFMLVMISTITMLITGRLLYNLEIPNVERMLLFVPTIFLLFVGVASLGIIIASLMKSFQSALSISLFAYFILLFLSGATIPLPVLPEKFQEFVMTYVPYSRMVLLLRNIWLGTKDNLLLNILISGIVIMLSFYLANKLFKWKNK